MNNFTCWNPTKIVFGKDTLGALGEELASLRDFPGSSGLRQGLHFQKWSL